MGQAYCQTCCGAKVGETNTSVTDFKVIDSDSPNPKFAKAVKQYIQLHPRVREIFLRERVPHVAQRKGIRLNLYYLFEYAAYYDGEWKSGLPHGCGRLIYDDGSIYEGCFREGQAECRKALFIKENGTFYKGEVRMNKAYGEGALTADKVCYRGNWYDDLPHGEGQQTYNRISYYLGNFQKGRKHGSGRYQWNQVEYYEGEFKNNQINGWGKHITKQFEYEGLFLNGQKQGQGVLKNTLKGWTYKGDFKQNKMHGKGVYSWPDSTRFEGTFENNHKKQGKLILVSGEVINDYQQ